MRKLQFIISLCITTGFVLVLNTRMGVAPPFGKFLDPFHGCWQNAEKNEPGKEEFCMVQGLTKPVKVYFDERMVPHVFAQTDEDMYFVQGYLTAKFRLWQMEIQTHNAAGRVSEIVGEKALENDRLNRRAGMEYGAEVMEQYLSTDPQSKKMVNAYCNGVNAYIHTLKPKDYPLEYKLLDYKPEEWKPVKVALLLKNMASQLSVFEFDIENYNFITKFGEKEFAALYPDFNSGEDPVIPAGTQWNFPAENNAKLVSSNSFDSHLYSNIIAKPDEITGSNNWAVSGTKSATGKPILCNDPHLKLTLPSIWYEMQLQSPNMNVYGVTIPGALGIIIGFNDSISWGMTNGGRDVRDWYKIKFKDASKDEYEYNGQWIKTEKKIEHYLVRGKGEVLDTVIYTKFGPVVFDESFGKADSKKNLSMHWTAHLPSNEFKTFYMLNSAKNYDDYIEALKYYNCPSQNFAFASRSGDIAIKHQGQFPIRDKATQQGKLISDGTTDKDEWKTFVPSENNPVIKNPERGYVSSANQHPTDSTYPYYYPGMGVYENYRNRRINQLLAGTKTVDVDFMKKMQADNFNLHASEALPVMLSLLDRTTLTADEKDVLSRLTNWNYYCNAGEIAPVYFELWWNELRKILWDEMLDQTVPMRQPNYYTTVEFLKNDSTSQFYDNRATPEKETRHDIVLQSFQHILTLLKAKQFTSVAEPYAYDKNYVKDDFKLHDWGTYKATRISHIADIDALSDRNVYCGGNIGLINATSAKYGPSWRMIVDEGNMKAYVIYPGGQSGNPGSVYYDDMVQDWAAGKYYEANFITAPNQLKDKKLTLTFDTHK